MTQIDVLDPETMTSPYGRTVSPMSEADLGALVADLVAAGLPYPSDLEDAGSPVEGARSRSLLLPMRDGVEMAVDLHLPPLGVGEQVPTVLRSTRYWRSSVGSPVKEHLEVLEVQRWLREGFALVLMDVRGTGASFGSWVRAWDDAQRDDLLDVIDWLVAQPWSDGTVTGYGTSYDGSTAHLLAASGHPAVRAVVPRFALYDSYADVAAPGGVPLDHFLENWAAVNWALDGHPDRATVPLPVALPGVVRAVDGDVDGSLLGQAQREHADNWDLWGDVRQLQVREDVGPGVDLGNGTPYARIADLREARVPMWLWSSWYDGAYAAAQLRQLADQELDVRVTIGPFSHGASMSPLGDPLLPSARNLPVRDQVTDMAAFLRSRATGAGVDPSPSALRYYRLGDGWREADAWPPVGVTAVRHALGGAGALGSAGGSRPWSVDHRASTGTAATRWHGLIGGGPVVYADRSTQDEHLLSWLGPVRDEAFGLTGTPVLHLDLTSSVVDLALHAYLEAALPDGRVLYLTEGLLRASHRHVAATVTSPAGPPQPSGPLVPGRLESLQWELLPISVLLPPGTRLRVSLAGADAPLFRRIPSSGPVDLEVHGTSWIDLPEESA